MASLFLHGLCVILIFCGGFVAGAVWAALGALARAIADDGDA